MSVNSWILNSNCATYNLHLKNPINFNEGQNNFMLLGRIPVVLKMQISQFTLQNLLVIGLNFLQSVSTFEPFIQEGYNHVLLLHSQIIDDLSFIGNLLRYKSIKCNIYCIKNLTVIFFKKIFRQQKNHPWTKIYKKRSSDYLGLFNLLA